VKVCNICCLEKEFSEFYKRTKGYRASCKKCYRQLPYVKYKPRPKVKRVAWNKGKKMSDEFCKKISASKSGRPLSERARINMIKALRERSTSSSRQSWRYKEWRNKVLERDDFKCVLCDCNDIKKLHVHHIDSYEKHKDKRLDLDNGLTLCRSCHGKEDGFKKGHVPWAKGRKFSLEHIMKSVNAKKIRRIENADTKFDRQ